MSPAVPLSLVALAGALTGLTTSLPPTAALLAAVASAAALAGALAVRIEQRNARALGLVLVTLLAAGFVATGARAGFAAAAARIPAGVVVLEGTVSDVAPARSGGRHMKLDVDGAVASRGRVNGAAAPVGARVLVSLLPSADAFVVTAGDRVRVRGAVHHAHPALQPGVLDGELAALANGIHGRMTVGAVDDAVVVERGARFAPFAAMRCALRERLHALLSPREAGIVLALLVGDTSDFDDDTIALYRRVGAGHLLAVSGLQVSLVALLAARLAWLAFSLRPRLTRSGRARRLAAAASLLVVWGFVGLCGGPPSAVRAGAMASAVVGGALFTRRVRLVEALAVAAMTTVLLSPESALDPGFLLSYAAVAGLAVVQLLKRDAAALPSTTEPAPLVRVRDAFVGIVTSSLAAGLLTLPLSAHLFGQVSLAGLVANIVLVPVASVLQVPAMGFGLAGALLNVAPIARLGAMSAGLLEALCEGLAQFLPGVLVVRAPDGWHTVLLLLAALAAMAALVRKPRALGSSSFCAALACAFTVAGVLPALHAPRGVRITVLPVGQGDASVFELPDGTTILIDGGGEVGSTRDPGREVVLPFLARRGIEKLDVVVLSHPHPDHGLGLRAVLEAMPVGALWHSGYPDDDAVLSQLLPIARRHNVAIESTPALLGPHRFGDVTVDVLGPAPAEGTAKYDELSANDNSLVLRVRYGDTTALWGGDLESQGEQLLIGSGADLHADVVKATHHGSKTSSTAAFVAATRPREVIFCTGVENRFGFPHAAVVDRWRAAGAHVSDTALEGEIAVFLTGHDVAVEPFAHRRPSPR